MASPGYTELMHWNSYRWQPENIFFVNLSRLITMSIFDFPTNFKDDIFAKQLFFNWNIYHEILVNIAVCCTRHYADSFVLASSDITQLWFCYLDKIKFLEVVISTILTRSSIGSNNILNYCTLYSKLSININVKTNDNFTKALLLINKP